MIAPQWVKDYIYKDFSLGPYMGEDGKAWIAVSRKWMRQFVKRIGATDFKLLKGHYEQSCFFKHKDQWWYCSSGDVRHRVRSWFLVRTATGPKDYSGGVNQSALYDDSFEDDLEKIICG